MLRHPHGIGMVMSDREEEEEEESEQAFKRRATG